MITANDIALILAAIAWPVVALVLAYTFKSDISDLLKRIQRARFPGGEATFVYGEASIDTEPPSPEPKAEPLEKPEQPEDTGIKWSNTGNLFWAGHDLMWTVDVLLRGAPREVIMHGLTQSLHHIRSLGISNHHIEKRLSNLVRGAEQSPEEWATPVRNSYTRELASLVRHLGDLAEANQPDFQPGPKK